MGNLLVIEAEARAYRALTYFNLVSVYAKPYALANENDPGIPVIQKNDVTGNQTGENACSGSVQLYHQ